MQGYTEEMWVWKGLNEGLAMTGFLNVHGKQNFSATDPLTSWVIAKGAGVSFRRSADGLILPSKNTTPVSTQVYMHFCGYKFKGHARQLTRKVVR